MLCKAAPWTHVNHGTGQQASPCPWKSCHPVLPPSRYKAITIMNGPTDNTLCCQVLVDPFVPEAWECFQKLPHGHKSTMEQVSRHHHVQGSNVTMYCRLKEDQNNHHREQRAHPANTPYWQEDHIDPLVPKTWDAFAMLLHRHKPTMEQVSRHHHVRGSNATPYCHPARL